MKRDLTDRYLKSLKPDTEKRIEVSDIKCVGLRFRLAPSGHSSWVYEKRIKGGKKRKFTFGTWPRPISLSMARSMAFEIQAEAARGFDRVEVARLDTERQRLDAATSITCREVLDAYINIHLSTLKTGKERERQLNAALGELMHVPFSKLSRSDLQAAVDRKAETGARPYANRIRSALLAFANWAFVRGYSDKPIGAGVAKATKEKVRERVLSIGEIRNIWAASYQQGEVWGPFFRLLILTGQRSGEVATLRWQEVNFQVRQIIKPGTETKNGKPHKTHLSSVALDELHKLKEIGASGEFVFSIDGDRPIASPSRAKNRIDKLLSKDFEPWRIHDIRTALATALSEAGEPENVVDRILNHSASGSAPSAVARVYNQADMLPQRAAALDRWAEMVTGEIGKVVNFAGNGEGKN